MVDPIERLTIESDIRNLIAQIARMSDFSESLEDYLKLWTEDGVYDVKEPVGWKPGEPTIAKAVAGHDALREDRIMLREIGFQGPGTDVWHVNTTLSVNVVDSDTAEAESYWILVSGKDPVQIIRIGHYHDTFRRTPEGWKIAYRNVLSSSGGPSYASFKK